MSSSLSLSVEDRITRSQVRVLKKFPFFGMLLLKLEVVENEEIGTFATDGRKLIYAPSFVNKLTEEELNWVIVHETMHPALGHIWRRKNRFPDLWNVACDYEIHSFMHQYMKETGEIGFMSMPKGGLYDTKYDNLSVDKIYEMLLDDYEKDRAKMQGLIDRLLDNHGSWEDGDGGDGDGNGDNGDSDSDGNGNDGNNSENTLNNRKDYLQKEWEGALVQAAQIASGKMAGKLPGCMARIVKKITRPQKDWRELLAECIIPVPDDYGFTPPDRRMQDFDFFMPDFTETTDTLGKVIFWIDTSGSMRENEITAVYNEIRGCIEQFGNIDGYVGCFDCSVHNFKKVDEVQHIMDYVPEGGGGTDFHVALQYIKDRDELQDGLQTVIILSDGEASYNNLPELDCPLIWILTNENIEPPVGTTAYIDPTKC